jgi:hypothetical protein
MFFGLVPSRAITVSIARARALGFKISSRSEVSTAVSAAAIGIV